MTSPHLTLAVLPGAFAICRLPADVPPPAWATGGAFFSATRTPDELSCLVEAGRVPDAVRCETGFCALSVVGPLAFDVVGVLAALVGPLAGAGIPVLTISTFDTDYIFVRADSLARAADALRAAGHTIRE